MFNYITIDALRKIPNIFWNDKNNILFHPYNLINPLPNN
ncbi:MAG: glutamyl-tRNA synthetase [Candidatus Cloacimonas acidaminovorans]|nr:glutamyl-tRNA synthetase [Candidatus Cloacimonas acidaminovorans]